MAFSFPRFPIKGQILSTNLNNERYSLVYNSVGSESFPVGQYLFYTKHGSLWFRYKTATQNWSNEFLFIQGTYGSNVKFDNNGYPVVGYLNLQKNILVRHYVNGLSNDAFVSYNGDLPTIIIDSLDVFVFWCPPYFNKYLFYTSLCENFNGEHPYYIDLEGQMTSLQIELLNNQQFLFTLGMSQGEKNKIYIAYTNIPNTEIGTDITASVNFI